MTVRGGGIPRRPLALTPNGRMGPPLRSFAADAHDCIMVRVLGPTGYKVVARLNRAPKAGSPLIAIATALSVPSCSKPSRYGLARAKHAARLVRRPILTASARIDLGDARVGMKKRTLRSNQETDEGKRCAALANSLTKKAPYKGLGAESEEKREPASDIDAGVVDSLKALDPDGRLEKRSGQLACGQPHRGADERTLCGKAWSRAEFLMRAVETTAGSGGRGSSSLWSRPSRVGGEWSRVFSHLD